MAEFRQRPAASLGRAAQAPKIRPGYVYFVRHFGVMVALMYAGMFVLDPVYEMAVALAGVDDPWGRLPVLSNIIMAFNMSVPMVLYMRHRRHAWREIVEMSAAMLLPAALTIGPYLLGIMTAGTMMSFSHAAMIPLMAVAMMLRFRGYAGHNQGHGLAGTAQGSGL
jgi:flagellar biosynthetic protein FliP